MYDIKEDKRRQKKTKEDKETNKQINNIKYLI